MTLIELIVAMGIFSVVISVFMAGLVVMTKDTARTIAVADSGDSVRKAFQRLDKQIRYASAINRPGVGGSGAHYVEFRTAAVAAGRQPRCTQWRLVPDTGLLQVRTWDDAPSASPSDWQTIIVNVRNDLSSPANEPFAFAPADGKHTRQQLVVTLDVGLAGRPGSDIQTTFVARNSSVTSVSNDDLDGDGQSDTAVCTAGRP